MCHADAGNSVSVPDTRANTSEASKEPYVQPDWTEQFFLDLVESLRQQGVRCAITGGLACIEFGVVEHTLDCDLLSDPAGSETMLSTLAATELHGSPCVYRGTMSAPLHGSWLEGGWTSHFVWERGPASAYLDVFGAPPRVHVPWWSEQAFPYATRPTVAAMKRTRRPKDWSQATALGLQLLDSGDERGWLHLFDADAIRGALDTLKPPQSAITRRPVLQLALTDDPLLERAIQTEIDFWSRLDGMRLGIYRRAATEYAARVRAHPGLAEADLEAQHEIRLALARECLPVDPLSDFGKDRLVADAVRSAGLGLDPALLQLLPAVGPDLDYGDVW